MTETTKIENFSQLKQMPLLLNLWARINQWGLKFFRKAWLPQYISPPFPGVLAHHFGPNLFNGHKKSFRQMTTDEGASASSYFQECGISALAEANGGICSFRFGKELAIYQNTNIPLVNDNDLAPSTDANRELFGDFVGSLQNDHPMRPAKRAVIESTLGNNNFINRLEPTIKKHALEYLKSIESETVPLDEFSLFWTAHVDSFIPGVLDLNQTPLTTYLASEEYGKVTRAFFEIASEVISKVNRTAMDDFEIIVSFTRKLLTDNFEALDTAPESNLIRRHFSLWGKAFTLQQIKTLSAAELKELGTIIVATYDTTALSLLWAIAFIETTKIVKTKLITNANHSNTENISLLDLIVLEAVRLGGSNPTALWRRTKASFLLTRKGNSVVIPKGTMIWLDRRKANCNPSIFPKAEQFDPENIRSILKSNKENLNSVLSRNRYEINSFSMINSRGNPRKCPGRIFSARMQSILLSELYSKYRVSTRGIDISIKSHSSMPRPARPGIINITSLKL